MDVRRNDRGYVRCGGTGGARFVRTRLAADRRLSPTNQKVIRCWPEGNLAATVARISTQSSSASRFTAGVLEFQPRRVNVEGRSATNSPFHELSRLQFRGSF